MINISFSLLHVLTLTAKLLNFVKSLCSKFHLDMGLNMLRVYKMGYPDIFLSENSLVIISKFLLSTDFDFHVVILLFVVHVCSVSFVASLWCSCDNRWSEDCRMLLRIWWRCDNDFRNLLKWQIVNCIYIYLSNDAMKHYKFCRSMILLSIIRGMSLLLNLR